MPLIFKRTPGSTVGYDWTEPDQGVEVEDREHAHQLLHMDSDFYEQPAEEVAEEVVGLPPVTGAGSGVKAWLRYAASKGLELPADATRDSVVQALVDAGVLTQGEGSEIREAGEGDDPGGD